MKKTVLNASCFILFIVLCYNTSAQQPGVLVMDAGKLVTLKKKIQQQDAPTLQLVSTLRKVADELLNKKPASVTDKAFTPASGDKHDYMSQAPYFWYDSSKTNGLPYIRKDGVRNPEIKWNYQQIGEYKKNNIYALLLQAAAVYKDPKYTSLAKQVDEEVNDVVVDLLNK